VVSILLIMALLEVDTVFKDETLADIATITENPIEQDPTNEDSNRLTGRSI